MCVDALNLPTYKTLSLLAADAIDNDAAQRFADEGALGSHLETKNVLDRRMDWPSRDSTVHIQPIFQRLGNPSLRWDGLPIRGKLTD